MRKGEPLQRPWGRSVPGVAGAEGAKGREGGREGREGKAQVGQGLVGHRSTWTFTQREMGVCRAVGRGGTEPDWAVHRRPLLALGRTSCAG